MRRILPLALACTAFAQTHYNAVDPRIGTANGGNTFPGASLPFGMIQWSPDTGEGWYFSNEWYVRGFSLTHLSGAGCPAFGDMPILPWSTQPGPDRPATPETLTIDRTREVAHPGFYSTVLDGTTVELAVTPRAGIAHLRFAPGKHPGLLLNHTGSANSNVHIGKLPPIGREHDGESLKVHPNGLITGTVTSGGFCGSDTRYTLHIALQTRTPPRQTLLWQNGKALAGTHAEGRRAAAWLDLGDNPDQLLKVGLSYVSEDKALANLNAELPGWDFNQVHREAEATWTRALNTIDIQAPNSFNGPEMGQKIIFYTALCHNLLAPSLFSDADGEYEGFDWQPHHVAPGQTAQYANFSDWDTYRDTTPLQAWLFPQQASDMAQSLVNDAQQSGSLPRWAIANDSSYVMGGDSASILLAEYRSFGATRFHTADALHFMLRGATVPHLGTHHVDERSNLATYLKLGYLPTLPDIPASGPTPWDISASETLEFANADFAAGQFALALGDKPAANTLLGHAGNWRNLLDPQTRWIRPRLEDGTWLPGFDAEKSLPHGGDTPVPTDQKGFQEGNTYQYTFMVPFDYAGLFRAIGDDAVVEQRLDTFFHKLVCWGEPCFNMANEPDFVTPYAYTFLGKPAKTAAVLHRIEDETFNSYPNGLAGNDDLGATSAVFLWNALGLYPAIPGLGGLVLGSPIFLKATLTVPPDKTLVITRPLNGLYVQSVKLNGLPYTSSWLPLSRLHAGRNTLAFTLTNEPTSTWATRPEDRPPSQSQSPTP